MLEKRLITFYTGADKPVETIPIYLAMVSGQQKSFIKGFILHRLFHAEISHFLEYVKLFDKYASTDDKLALLVEHVAPFDPVFETAYLSNMVNEKAQILIKNPFVFCKSFFNARNYKLIEQLIIQYSQHSDCSLKFQHYVNYFFRRPDNIRS